MLGGIYAAVLTPLDAQLRPDANKAARYYAQLLERGCDGLNVLGTTGEAMSLGLRQRTEFMEALALALPVRRCMVGVGACALEDAVELSRTALRCGFGWLLVIPPFYYRDAGHEGVMRFFDALFARTLPPQRSVLLYNFPKMSGVTFTAQLVERIVDAFPGIIAGVKDSSNDAELELQIAQCAPPLAVFPGSEALLAHARRNGLAGCISGSICLWPELAASYWKSGGAREQQRLVDLRAALAPSLIDAVRAAVARETGDAGWARSLPPLGEIAGGFSQRA